MSFWGFWTDIIAHARQRARVVPEGVATSELGTVALGLARADLGNGEVGGNNRGPHVERWGRGKTGIAHCSAAVCWWVEEALKTFPAGTYPELERLFTHPRWPRWRLVAKRAWSELGKVGEHVERPLPGDVVLFERGRDDDWRGHVEICDDVVLGTEGRFTDIAANLGRYPALVKRVPRQVDKQRYIGAIRLP